MAGEGSLLRSSEGQLRLDKGREALKLLQYWYRMKGNRAELIFTSNIPSWRLFTLVSLLPQKEDGQEWSVQGWDKVHGTESEDADSSYDPALSLLMKVKCWEHPVSSECTLFDSSAMKGKDGGRKITGDVLELMWSYCKPIMVFPWWLSFRTHNWAPPFRTDTVWNQFFLMFIRWSLYSNSALYWQSNMSITSSRHLCLCAFETYWQIFT